MLVSVFPVIVSTHSFFGLRLVLANRQVVTGTEGGTKMCKNLQLRKVYMFTFFSTSGKLIIFDLSRHPQPLPGMLLQPQPPRTFDSELQ